MKKEESISLTAIIFDMDGVLVDSEKHWQKVGSDLVSRWIPSWSVDDSGKIMGLGCEPLYDLLCNEYELSGAFSDFKKDYNQSIKTVYDEKAELLDGVLDLLLALKKEGMLLAAATSSLRPFLNTVLQRFNLHDIFNVALSVSDINCSGKPEPDIYLRTAERLGVEISSCLAIEDSWAGVSSATRAGMQVVGLRNGFNDSQDLSEATSIINGFREVNVNTLIEIFHKAPAKA